MRSTLGNWIAPLSEMCPVPERHPFISNQAQALSFRGREAEPGTHEHRSLRTVAHRLWRRVYGSRAPLRSPGMTEPGISHLERILR